MESIDWTQMGGYVLSVVLAVVVAHLRRKYPRALQAVTDAIESAGEHAQGDQFTDAHREAIRWVKQLSEHNARCSGKASDKAVATAAKDSETAIESAKRGAGRLGRHIVRHLPPGTCARR